MNEVKMVKINEVYLKSEPNSGKMVILKEEPNATRYFMMFVGDSEFAAIAKEKGLVDTERPLTHELYLRIIEKLSVEFVRVEIIDLRNDTFFANVVLLANGSEQKVDSRPSDAVALALNRRIPIVVKEGLLRRELTEQEVKEYEEIVKTVKF